MTVPADGRPDATSVLLPGPWSHRTISANGIGLHVAEAGEGPLVLLLHGFPQFWWAFRHQLPALAEAGYRAAAMDLRGFGASDKPPRGYDPRTLADDAAGVIRSLGERDAAVVGQGLGGQVAWTLAVVHPRQVRRVVPVAMPHPRRLRHAHLTSPEQFQASRYVLGFQRPMLPERALVADDAQQVAELLRAWSRPGYPDADVEATYRLAARVPGAAYCAMEAFRWAVRSLPRPDGRGYYRRMASPVTVPTLQVHGALDPAILPGEAQGCGRYVDAPYDFALVERAGHFVADEAPGELNRILLDWLADDSLDS